MQKLELVQEVKLTFLHNLFDYVGTKKFSNCCPGCGGTSYKMDWDAIAGAKNEVLKNTSLISLLQLMIQHILLLIYQLGMTIGLLFVRLI
jgi:hypothetical protein